MRRKKIYSEMGPREWEPSAHCCFSQTLEVNNDVVLEQLEQHGSFGPALVLW